MVKIIVPGTAEGEVLSTKESISFFGGVDPSSGTIIENGHELFGETIKNKILIFPQGKGSTVGSYILYRMKKEGTAPKAIIVKKAEPIMVVGCVLADIPLLEAKNLSIRKGDFIKIKDGKLT